jgi:hypothetical protein
VTVELITRLLAAQREIETLRIWLKNADVTIRGYMRMVDGQASDLYASDTDTWSATSLIQGSGKEPEARSGHSLPIWIMYSIGAPKVMLIVISCVVCDVLFHACECLM